MPKLELSTVRAVERFQRHLEATLWPEEDDSGAPRFQVNEMALHLTTNPNSAEYHDGVGAVASFHLVPGANGLQVTWHGDLPSRVGEYGEPVGS